MPAPTRQRSFFQRAGTALPHDPAWLPARHPDRPRPPPPRKYGARISEIHALRGADVDLDVSAIRIRTLKRRAEHWREIPAPPELLRTSGPGPWPSDSGRSRGALPIGASPKDHGRRRDPKPPSVHQGLRHRYGIAAVAAGVPLSTIAARSASRRTTSSTACGPRPSDFPFRGSSEPILFRFPFHGLCPFSLPRWVSLLRRFCTLLRKRYSKPPRGNRGVFPVGAGRSRLRRATPRAYSPPSVGVGGVATLISQYIKQLDSGIACAS